MKRERDEFDFSSTPFSVLIQQSQELVSLRAEYASRSESDRLRAADWACAEALAAQLFNGALARVTADSGLPRNHWPPGVEALAIDPRCAQALLMVGSLEHQCGRRGAAMDLFEQLLRLPPGTKQLLEIVDKAGMFLYEQHDQPNAQRFYSAAVERFPDSTLMLAGLAFCLARAGRPEAAIAVQQRAIALEQDSHELLTDLGWMLVESGRYGEAEKVLKKAVAKSPPDYELARENLKELRRRWSSRK